ncbi:MAG TPA: glycosyltransferase [Candidatus Acidoferrales bacterium]|nr:glycosyltransferase [Candidatus Acidoferrales bacterium]
MKILHVVQAYYPFQEKGGPVFKVRALAETMARHGHEVTVLTADLGLAEHPEIAGRCEVCPWGRGLKFAGVEILYLPTMARYRAMTLNPRVLDFCETQLGKFDVIHFFGLYDLLGPGLSYFAGRRNIPYVVEPMGMYRPIDRSLRLKALWHSLLGGKFLKNAARMVATSEIEQRELLDAGFSREKVMVRYNGVDTDSFAHLPQRGAFRSKWDLPVNEPLIIFLSRLIPRKGAKVLIEAFANACPRAGRLVIAGPEGESGYLTQLKACASKCGVADRVVFTGAVYDEDKKSLYADADVFALPSRYENFANVAAEAMASGVPVILSEGCGISVLVEKEKAGLIVPAEVEAVSNAIGAVLSDTALYAKLKEGCKRLTAQLDWEQLAVRMEDAYQASSFDLHNPECPH